MLMLDTGLSIAANTTASISETFPMPINEIVIMEAAEGVARPAVFTLMLQTFDSDGREVLSIVPLHGAASDPMGVEDLVIGAFDPLPPGTHRWLLSSSVDVVVHVAARPPALPENAPTVLIGAFSAHGRPLDSFVARINAQAGMDESMSIQPWRWEVIPLRGDGTAEILASSTPIIVVGDSAEDDAVAALLASRAEEPPAPTIFFQDQIEPVTFRQNQTPEPPSDVWLALVQWCRGQRPNESEEG